MIENLPRHLQERTRALGSTSPGSGDCVVYWMHHALRVEENPALDVARRIACAQQKPLLVVQGLGGRHPYNNDRHHLFALQSARDVARALSKAGIAHRFHLDAEAHGRLSDYARRATAVIVDEMPVPPFPAWHDRLATTIDAPVLAVDGRCIVPMQLVPKRYDRAFAFRKASAEEYAARLQSSYPECTVEVPAAHAELTADAFALASASDADLLAAIANCPIDHSVAPAWDTPGGSEAAQTRWQQFFESGLRDYDRRRNDAAEAPPRGVSRLSAYLHYGCISPFRVAREAAFAGGSGANKYLDELFVWRELAHNFCYHTPQLNTLDAIPQWARDTLHEHRDDAREAIFSWDTLAHARTGEPLWDRAQRSLLIHGELHNNVRMTWAKQLLQWTASPERALAMLLDLNHRYALDGSDPNSYGGLLWAMGQFDRPFKPPVAVLGTVRPRSIKAHAKRLDQARWGERIDRPAGHGQRVVVIGAGISGLAAARTLADHGHEVTVFDKGRGVGGRMSTRRADQGGFDHGAQYFTVRDEAFARRVSAWEEDGLVAPWPQSLVHIDQAGRSTPVDPQPRFAAVPGMSALCERLAAGLDVRGSVEVEALVASDSGWQVGDRTADQVIVTVPLPQVAPLLAATPELTRQLPQVAYLPCHAAMLTLPEMSAPFDAATFDDDVIAWVACDSAKPGRRVPQGLSRWVVHATSDWSQAHLDTDKQDIADHLAARVQQLLPDFPAAIDAVGHRWRYARVESAPAPLNTSRHLGRGVWLAGDACAGRSRVESAWCSGVSAAAGSMVRANL
jgi:photolyase PhrII